MKLEIHVWYKKFFHDELVLMLFGAAVDSLLKTIVLCGSFPKIYIYIYMELHPS